MRKGSRLLDTNDRAQWLKKKQSNETSNLLEFPVNDEVHLLQDRDLDKKIRSETMDAVAVIRVVIPCGAPSSLSRDGLLFYRPKSADHTPHLTISTLVCRSADICSP
uniref:Uncharacterized protein n=1 Tax=Brassica campestris TaxID=3711 RepID=M4FFF9_BRACM